MPHDTSAGTEDSQSNALRISSLVRSRPLSVTMIRGSLASATPRSQRPDTGTCSNRFTSHHTIGETGIRVSWISMYRRRSPSLEDLKIPQARISHRDNLRPPTMTASSVIRRFGAFLSLNPIQITPSRTNRTPAIHQNHAPTSSGHQKRIPRTRTVSTDGKTLVRKICLIIDGACCCSWVSYVIRRCSARSVRRPPLNTGENLPSSFFIFGLGDQILRAKSLKL